MTTTGFTDQDVETYLRADHNICPNCHSSNIDYTGTTDYTLITVTFTQECLNCRCKWRSVFTISSITRL